MPLVLLSFAWLQTALAVGSTVVSGRAESGQEGKPLHVLSGMYRLVSAALASAQLDLRHPRLTPPTPSTVPHFQVFGDKYLAAFRLDFIADEPAPAAAEPEAAAAPAEAPPTPEAAAAPAPEQ